MRTTKQKSIGAVALFSIVLTVQSVFAYYNPSTGRFLSRDPLGEPGFQALQRVQAVPQPTAVASSSSRWIQRDRPNNENRYLFVGNSPVNSVDPLGLIKFEGCEGREEQLQQQFNSFCQKLKDPNFANCLGCSLSARTIIARLKNRCNNPDDSLHGITVKCEKSDSGTCKGACGWSIPGGDKIHICPEQWSNPGCGEPGCTLLHELTHMSGRFGEKWPTKVEKCLGCQ